MKLFLSASILAISIASMNTQAALYDRGNGMIYDSDQNITWLQDANYAGTTGYSTALPNTNPDVRAPGAMTWYQATNWATNLAYGGYSDWRLPSAKLIADDGSHGGYDGHNNASYNNTRSEIGHLYAELGNFELCQPSALGCEQAGPPGLLATGYFLNAQNYDYWEAEEFGLDTNSAWNFYVFQNNQRTTYKGVTFYAWAVRDGDVAAVPLPSAAWLFASSLLGLATTSIRSISHRSLTRRFI